MNSFSSDEYITVVHPGHAETRILASRFIADAVPMQIREEGEGFLQTIRRKYHDATHHCYAYRLGVDSQESRAADDGEPSGTAGKPILGAIEHAGLTNTLVVVTRYFGGTKLGTGGLVRAYGEAAGLALRDAGVRTLVIGAALMISVDYPAVKQILRTASRFDARIVDARYETRVRFHVEVRRSRLEQLRAELIEATSGGVRFED